MEAKRKLPSANAWRELAEACNTMLARNRKALDPNVSIRDAERLEFRAAKTLATAWEHGRHLGERTLSPEARGLRQAIHDEEVRRRFVESKRPRPASLIEYLEAKANPIAIGDFVQPLTLEGLQVYATARNWLWFDVEELGRTHPERFDRDIEASLWPMLKARFRDDERREAWAWVLAALGQACLLFAEEMAGEVTDGQSGQAVTVEAARRSAEAILLKQGLPQYRGKPSYRGLAKRVGCNFATIKRAVNESPKLRKAFATPDGSREAELKRLEAEQELDRRSRHAL